MAIIIEEKKETGMLVTILVWVGILAIIAAGAYYVFFKKPELVEFTASSSFANIQQLSKISIDSDKLINSPQFQSLKQYITVTPPQNVGKTNPFLGF